MITPEDAILALLARRGAGRTICPSEAARVLAGETGAWRTHMEPVHQAVDRLHAAGAIALTWKGEELAERRGPYRIARRT